MFSKQQYMRILVAVSSIVVVAIVIHQSAPHKISIKKLHEQADHWAQDHLHLTKPKKNYTHSLVVASTAAVDTSWVFSPEMPEFEAFVYVADDQTAPYHPPKNKGNEAMMYMTHIIDHYHNLTDIVTFIHAHQETWHNNDLFDLSITTTLRHLRLAHVDSVGYFNLRCHPDVGCPPEPLIDQGNIPIDGEIQNMFHTTWDDLHGPNPPPIPFSLAAACCAQFSVSRAAITRIPLERWIHYREWLLHTPLVDAISGRIWEFTWHYVFTGHSVLCPDLQTCYCQGYGLCFEDNAEIDALLTMKETLFLADGRVGDLTDQLAQEEEESSSSLGSQENSLGPVVEGVDPDEEVKKKQGRVERIGHRQKGIGDTMWHSGNKLRRVYDYRLRAARIKGMEMFDGYRPLGDYKAEEDTKGS